MILCYPTTILAIITPNLTGGYEYTGLIPTGFYGGLPDPYISYRVNQQFPLIPPGKIPADIVV